MKRKIISCRLICFMVLAAFFLLHALRTSLALTHQDRKPAISLQQTFMSVQIKELVEDAKVGKRKVLGGRRMAAIGGKTKRERDGTMLSSKLSAGRNKANGEHAGRLAHEEGPLTRSSATLIHKQVGLSRSPVEGNAAATICTTQKCIAKAAVVTQLPPSAAGKDTSRHGDKHESSSQRKLDKEIMSLMRKDYQGLKKPKRKPPINNSVPMV